MAGSACADRHATCRSRRLDSTKVTRRADILLSGRPATQNGQELGCCAKPEDRRLVEYLLVATHGLVKSGPWHVMLRQLAAARRGPVRSTDSMLLHQTEASTSPNSSTVELDPTGERMLPQTTDPTTFWEHVMRYRFVLPFAAGRRTLDVACGEGYGASSLAHAGARSVIGVDISSSVCSHAHRKYGIQTIVADGQALPFARSTMDLVVSFETVEHVSNPGHFLQECSRVLAPGGKLIISTPNRDVYRARDGCNPFHCAELLEHEFRGLISEAFGRFELFAQTMLRASWWRMTSSVPLSPWRPVRRVLRAALRHNNTGSLATEHRNNAVATVLDKEPLLVSAFNPYKVRRYSPSSKVVPVYFIAVCSQPRHGGWGR